MISSFGLFGRRFLRFLVGLRLLRTQEDKAKWPREDRVGQARTVVSCSGTEWNWRKAHNPNPIFLGNVIIQDSAKKSSDDAWQPCGYTLIKISFEMWSLWFSDLATIWPFYKFHSLIKIFSIFFLCNPTCSSCLHGLGHAPVGSSGVAWVQKGPVKMKWKILEERERAWQ